MKITKNGFYKSSELDADRIVLGDNLGVVIYDNENKNIEIDIGENTSLEFYGLLDKEGEENVKFNQNRKGSNLKVRYLFLSRNNTLKSKIFSELSSDNTASDVKIISLVGDNGFVDIDGIVQINKGIKGVEGNLSEENIFMGSSGKIKGIPTLLVRSNDVKASHACKMERISDEQLFYLRSRGIEKDNSVKIMLEAKMKNHFRELEKIDQRFYENLIEDILLKIV